MTISRNLSFLAEGVSSTGVLGATYGGTGQSSITTGDLLYGSASNTISKLAIGSTGTILRVVGGVPTWGTDYTGTVTSVAASVPAFLSISGSPITTSGTLAITYSGTALPVANGGTGLTSLTAGQVLYGSFNQSSNLYFDGTNLGLGLTPNVWGTGAAFQGFGGNLWFRGVASGVSFNHNYAFYSGTNAYLETGYASRYLQYGGYHYWYTAPSGTAGTAVTFTQAMQIANSGGVSIGNTTDPGAGNLRFNTTGTNGIYFGSSARLDDYEEGTWTPTLSSFLGTITTVGNCVGVYRKIGKQVFLAIDCAITVNGTGSALILIGNLPYAGSGAVTGFYSASGEERSTSTALTVEYQVSNSRLAVYTYNGGYPGGNLTRFIISLNYPT